MKVQFNRVLEHFDSSGETFALWPSLKLNFFFFLKLIKYVTLVTLADSFTLWAR